VARGLYYRLMIVGWKGGGKMEACDEEENGSAMKTERIPLYGVVVVGGVFFRPCMHSGC